MPSYQNSPILVGARGSPLAQAQVKEVADAIRMIQSSYTLQPLFWTTLGDRDRQASLKTQEKTDFFTREIDQALLAGKCRIAIHSAKDLPDPLPKGLRLAAMTQGVSSEDVLVVRDTTDFATLNEQSIASSSLRRDQTILRLYPQAKLTEIRGTIEERLEQLDQGKVDGVVMAKAALIRLNLQRKTQTLPGPTAPLQGKLAILIREHDEEMALFFAPLDSRPFHRILYLGLDPSRYSPSKNTLLFHYPVIRIVNTICPDKKTLLVHLNQATHLLITSRHAVEALKKRVPLDLLKGKIFLAIGPSTAAYLTDHNLLPTFLAPEATSEGMCRLVEQLPITTGHLFWPHSARSRPHLADFCHNWCWQKGVAFSELSVYDTVSQAPFPPPSLQGIDEVVFTSPSTVKGWIDANSTDGATMNTSPMDESRKITAIGPVTADALYNSPLLNSGEYQTK